MKFMDYTHYHISNIIGHKKPIQFLNGLFVNDRIPSGLIFYGQKNIGKLFVALSFVASVLCKDYSSCNYDIDQLECEEKDFKKEKYSLGEYFCGKCPSCVGVLNGTNQNLMVVEPDGNSIKIDKIHRINSLLNLTSTFGGHRFVIIDDASAMNQHAMGALLKILEEPPDKTVFILISSNISGLFQTIISRCSLLDFRPIEDEILFKAVKGEFQDMRDDTLAVYMRLAKGSYSNLKKLIVGRYFETRKSILALIFNKLFYKNATLLTYDMSDAFNDILKNFKDDDGYQGNDKGNEDRVELFEIFLFILRDIFIYHMTKNEKLLYNMDICDDIGKFITDSNITPDRLLSMIELTVNHIDKMSYNLNKTIAMDAYFTGLLT